MNAKYVLLALSLLVILHTILQIAEAQSGVSTSDSKLVKNGTKNGAKKGTTVKPGFSSTSKAKGRATTRKLASGNRPRAPITGKPVPASTSKPKSKKTLSPLLAPRNPKHTTTTTPQPDEDEYEADEEED